MTRGWLVAAALLATAAALPARQRTPLQMDIAAWAGAVNRHTPGTLDEEGRGIARWPWERLEPVLDWAGGSGTDPAFLFRAATLYADMALIMPIRDRPAYGRPTIAVVAADGQPTGRTWIDTHLEVAQEIVSQVVRRKDATAGDRDLASSWFRAVGMVLANEWALADLEPHLGVALRIFPGDAALIYAAGCMSETFAAPRVLSARPPQTPVRRTADLLAERRYSRDANLSDAERYFRRALERDPAMTIARVRLVRVLLERGRPEAALREVAALRPAGDSRTRFLAALFAGQALEADGRRDEALARYQAALALYPRAQSAHLAAANVMADLGSVTRSRTVVLDLLSRPATDEQDDPWWTYHHGPGPDATRTYAEWGARVQALPRAADPAGGR